MTKMNHAFLVWGIVLVSTSNVNANNDSTSVDPDANDKCSLLFRDDFDYGGISNGTVWNVVNRSSLMPYELQFYTLNAVTIHGTEHYHN